MGYMQAGKILWVDLTSGQVRTESSQRYEEQFIGGRGVAVKLVYDNMPARIDALEPESMMVFSAGPFTGTIAPGTGRTNITHKSATTGALNGSNMGGMWAPELRSAGYDHLVVVGKAEKPVYISIENDQVELKDAAAVWGLDTFKTQDVIAAELNDLDTQILCIGPAGEKCVRHSIAMTGLTDICGRNGIGAIFGSKNLKAIAVRGTGGVKIADPEKYLELAHTLHMYFREDPLWDQFRTYGVTVAQDDFAKTGMVFFKNGQETMPSLVDEVNHEEYLKKNQQARLACFSCPVGCKETYRVDGKQNGAAKCVTYWALGAQLGTADMDLWYEATVLCTKGGLDSTQVTGIIGWLMELHERGMIDATVTDGIAMEWGSHEAILGIIHKMINREGIGEVLAEGYKSIAKHLGEGTEDYFFHHKGNAPETVDYRVIKATALGAVFGKAITSPGVEQVAYPHINRPGRYSEEEKAGWNQVVGEYAEAITGDPKSAEAGDVYDGKVLLMKHTEDNSITPDVMGYCKWHSDQSMAPHQTEMAASFYSAGKGQEFTSEYLLEMCDRVKAVERAFDVRDGVTREKDKLSKRFYEPIKDGPFKGSHLDREKMEEMKTEYYTLRGWDPETGIPTRETLERLGLASIADDLDAFASSTAMAE